DYSNGPTRDVDEYNRRSQWTDGITDEDSIGNAANDSTDAESSDENGDYSYTKRILRFNAPTIGLLVSSPLYWDLCYGPNSIYWDVYDDGVYAYAYPSTWNSLYWGPYFSYGWGWGGPWYGGWYSPWYYGSYWHHPHWGYPGPIGPSRPVRRPSLLYRENSTLARGTNSRQYGRTTLGRRISDRLNSNTTQRRSWNDRTYTPQSSSTNNRQPMVRSNSMPSRSSSYTPSTSRGTFSPSFSMPSRSGGFSPSRGGGMPRGGRR
ncbi:MAG: hypothetical protein LUC45_08105, partial [Paraprevotella sp.]|nr:hypothetical protein [Paraprevotella sp.]